MIVLLLEMQMSQLLWEIQLIFHFAVSDIVLLNSSLSSLKDFCDIK